MSVLVVAGLVAAMTEAGVAAPSGPIHAALSLETRRTLDASRAVGLERPYYVSGLVVERGVVGVEAVEGDLVPIREGRGRWYRATVRVGGRDFDQSGFDDPSARRGAGAAQGRFPLDDEPTAMRRALWLALDDAYREAASVYAAKLAFVTARGITSSETDAGDFTAEPKRVATTVGVRQTSERELLEALASRLSTVLREVGVAGRVRAYRMDRRFTFVDTEGSAIDEPSGFVAVEAAAWDEAPDGMPVHDTLARYAPTLERLGQVAELEQGIRAMAARVLSAASAPALDEPYHGPILLEGSAPAEVARYLLSANVVEPRQPLSASGGGTPQTEWAFRLKSRVLHPALSLVDDPTLRERAGTALLAIAEHDMEGIRARRVELVTQGILRAYLGSRHPRPGSPTSDGHARSSGGPGWALGVQTLPSTLVLTATGADTMAPDEVRARLRAEIEARDLPFGIVVRKLDDDSLANLGATDSLDMSEHAQKVHARSGLEPPVDVFRVYREGREERIRGVRWGDVRTDVLRNILAATPPSAPESILNAVHSSSGDYATSGPLDAGGVPVSVIAPGMMLLEDVGIEPVPGPFPTHSILRARKARAAAR